MAAVSVEAKIINGLIEHFNGITLPAGVTVAYRNANFVKPTKIVTISGKAATVPVPYVELIIGKNPPINSHLGGGKEPIRRGLFLANVYWPVGQGIVQASELAGTIRNHFAFNTQINHDGIRIWITEEPTVQGDEQGPVYSVIPVVTPWRVFP